MPILLGVGLLGGNATAWAQLTEEDLAALRARGEREGWTFTIRESEATTRPLAQLAGAVEPPDWRQKASFDPCLPTRGLPSAWDWRSVPGFPAVRNQGGCGSCWAFAAIGAMECALAREASISKDLSEQWLVSCNQDGMDCEFGGWHTTALDYLTCGGRTDPCGGNGAVLESSFPYVGWDAPCNCPYEHPYCLNSWFMVGTEWGAPSAAQIKQAIYDHGPVAVSVYVNYAFQAYGGGVFNACESQSTNHAVVLVGWDDNQGPHGVWIMRNSWGPSWGEAGYMRIAYDCCRIGYCTSYVNYQAPDCNHNGIPDSQDITNGTSQDCNGNGIPDECEPGGSSDCNADGTSDLCELFAGTAADCNGNGIPDSCDLASGVDTDCNNNGIPDYCEMHAAYRADDGSMDTAWGTDQPDFTWLNRFTVQPGGETVDALQIAWGWIPVGTSAKVALWSDPNGDGDPQDAQLLWKSSSPVIVSAPATDTFQTVSVPNVRVGEVGAVFFAGAYTPIYDLYNCWPAALDLSVPLGGSWMTESDNLDDLSASPLYAVDDFDGGVFLIRAHCAPPDCNGNGELDSCDIAEGTSPDVNGNGVPDECDPDCNGNGVPDDMDIAGGASKDCNANGQPDECEAGLGVMIVRQPEAVTTCPGESVTLAVSATGTGTLAYQWRKSQVPIAGATQRTFTIPAVMTADAGTYDVVVSSSCTSDMYPPETSAEATVALDHAEILAQPANTSAAAGDMASFSVSASGPQAFSYQWRKGGQPIAGAVLAAYAIPAVTVDDAGVYDVVITGCGEMTSAAATLTVTLRAPALPVPGDGAKDVPIDAALRWGAVPGAAEYEVYLGTDTGLALLGKTSATTWSPGPLAYNTKYSWKVVARHGAVAGEGAVWTFVTVREPVWPPAAPAEPFPADGTSDVPREVELTWGQATGAAFYKVLLGTDPGLADAQLLSSTELCRFAPAGLKVATTYYWRVVAKNEGGQTAGPIWSFTTKSDTASPSFASGEEPTASEPNSAADASPVDANTPTESGHPTVGQASGLCPTTGAVLMLIPLLGLWGLRARGPRGRGTV
jgi:hypothetical protein